MTGALSVVHVVWGAGFGGIETFVADIARGQADKGIRVTVLVCGTPAGDALLERYASPGVTVIGAGLRSGFDLRPEPLRTIVRTLAAADVVHMHGFTPSVALVSARTGRPVVYTEHGLLGLGRRWPSPGAVRQSTKALFLRRQATIVAGVSDWVTKMAGDKYRIAPSRLRVVPDGTDLGVIGAGRDRDQVFSDEGIAAGTWVIAVTARLVDFKRIDRLISACALLKPHGRDWTALVVGSGPLEDRLKEQAGALGLGPRVRFPGYRDQVWDLVAAADLVAVPSENEPFGLVVLEAMALGRPVVAFADSGGPAEIIGEVGGGCLVDRVDELAAVMELSRGGQPLPGYRPLDRARFEDLYSIDKTSAAYERLYLEALSDTEKGCT